MFLEGKANHYQVLKHKWELIRDAAQANKAEMTDRLVEEVGESQLQQFSLEIIHQIAVSNLEYLEEYKDEYLDD